MGMHEGPGPHVGTPAREESPPEPAAVGAAGHDCPGPCTPLLPPLAPAPPILARSVTAMRSAPLGFQTACQSVRMLRAGMTRSQDLLTGWASCQTARAQTQAASSRSASRGGQAAGEVAELLQVGPGEGLAACTAG